MTYLCTITTNTEFHPQVLKRIINASSELEAKILLLHRLVESPLLEEEGSFMFSVEKVEKL
jgi:hypothetical protein